MINLVLTLIAIALFVYFLLKWGTRNHDLFEKQGIKYLKPLPLIGTSGYMFKGKGLVDKIADTYNQFPNEKVVGLFEFNVPQYMIRSPEIVKHITVKDFAHFQDHQNVVDASVDEFMGNSLLSMRGQQWRDMRSSLSPMFTGSKMRSMLQLIVETSKQLVEHLNEDYEKNGLTAYKMKDLFSRYTNDVIATCAFGVSINSFKNKDNEIYQIGQEIQSFQKPSLLIKFICMRMFPRLAKFFGMKFIKEKSEKIFNDLIINTMEVRKREGIIRPDMIQLLMKLREGQLSKTQENNTEDEDNDSQVLDGDGKRTWTDSELISQSFIFFLAGFDTSSGAMMFLAYELAVNPDIQTRLVDEIDETNKSLAGKPLTYEILGKMKYLDMVVSETLRKWPPGVALDRECVKTYTYEDEDGFKFTIEKGKMIWLPVYGFHRDPKYYPNPEKFDPERFNDENKAKIDVSSTYIPFGVGPRSCIGLRFALMEIKALFFSLLLNYRLKVCEDTQVPLKLKRMGFGLIPEKEIQLYIEPRSDKIIRKYDNFC